MYRLKQGEAIVIHLDYLLDSARYYTDSAFNEPRMEDVKSIINEINSDEYPEYSISKIYGGARVCASECYCLRRHNKDSWWPNIYNMIEL